MRAALALSLSFLVLAWLPAGCTPKAEKKPTKTEIQHVRNRSADAFADLEAAERGEKAPPPKAPQELDEPPPPKPAEKPKEEPKPAYTQKPVEVVPVNPARAAPDWVNAQPSMEGYYIGIGVATGRGDEGNDWSRARNAAYVELSSTLKVHIQSVIVDYFKENNLRLYKGDNVTQDTSRTDSAYRQDTQFFVDQTLEGVEIHDRWKDAGANKYWMLVRLSKAEIARRIRERLEKAQKKAVDYVLAGLKAEGANRLGEAFKAYFQSYLALREYFGGVIDYDLNGDGKPEVLNHEIERAVARLAADLEWQTSADKLQAVNGRGLESPLQVTVRYKGNPVASLPVVFAFQRGKGSIEGRVSTGADGLASARVVKIFGDKEAILGSQVDVQALTENERDLRVIQEKFGNDLQVKTGKFYVQLEELSAFVSVREVLLGQEADASTVVTDIKEQLHKELGLVFTASAKGADMEITGEVVVDACSEFFAQRQCTARVNVTVADRVQNRQLFAKKYTVKGNGANDQEAGREALAKSGKRIAKALIEGLK